MNQRLLALGIIRKTISDESFTNLLMRKELEKIEPIQRPFVTNLVNGVLKNYDYLLFNIKPYIKKTSLKNKIILVMGLYERFYLNKEAYVVNNEYVNLAESEFDKAFINATLRKIDHLKDSEENYINHSLPEWLYKLICSQYCDEDAKLIFNNYASPKKTYYHLNPNKATYKDLEHLNIDIIDDKIFTAKKSLVSSDEFKDGLFYIQDINAAKLIDELHLNKNDVFLDGCAAPGSKFFNGLELINEENGYANDVSETRVNLIKNKAMILGYERANYSNLDARELPSIYPRMFNKILLDVPCSGLGVIGRKVDIKYHISPESLDRLQSLQYEILEAVSRLLTENGLLLYSTCTINKKENRKQVDKFVNKHPEFKIIKDETILNLEGDLFYYCLIQRL